MPLLGLWAGGGDAICASKALDVQAPAKGRHNRFAMVFEIPRHQRVLPLAGLLWIRQMDDQRRLELIAKAVLYCQSVKNEMPPSCYSKALREPIFFLWECRKCKRKDLVAQFRSKATLGLKSGIDRLRYDHAIPMAYLEKALLGLPIVTVETVSTVLHTMPPTGVLITKEEDALLTKAGYRSKMPKNWDGKNLHARYEAIGLEIIKNEGIC